MSKKNKTRFSKISNQVSKNSGSILVFIIVLSIIAVFLFADRGTVLFYKSYSDKEKLEDEIQQLEKKLDQLKIEKEKLESDPKYIEKIAREKYKMKKKNEKVYQVEMEKD
jgi:cell division protein DivIC